MQIDAYPEEIEGILKTDYYVYAQIPSGKTHVACDECVSCPSLLSSANSNRYHLPAHIQQHVDYITPGIRLSVGGNRAYNKRDSESLRSVDRSFEAGGRKPRAPHEGFLEERGFRTGSYQKFSKPLMNYQITVNLTGLGNLTSSQLLDLCDEVVTPICISSMADSLPYNPY